jgi:hypothetical protein
MFAGCRGEVRSQPVLGDEPFGPAVGKSAALFEKEKRGSPEKAVEKEERTRENRRCHISPLRPTMLQREERCKSATQASLLIYAQEK